MGIIDILQNYRLKKKLEHAMKAMVHDGVSFVLNLQFDLLKFWACSTLMPQFFIMFWFTDFFLRWGGRMTEYKFLLVSLGVEKI